MGMANLAVPHKDLNGSTLWVELENKDKDHIDAAIYGKFVFAINDVVDFFYIGQIHIGTRGESRSTALPLTMPPLTIPGQNCCVCDHHSLWIAVMYFTHRRGLLCYFLDRERTTRLIKTSPA